MVFVRCVTWIICKSCWFGGSDKILKSMAGSLKLELAQFREVEGFTKLGFVLDDATKQLVERVFA